MINIIEVFIINIIYQLYYNIMSINGQLWKDVLDIWENSYMLKYPKNIKKQFFWRTTPSK